MNNNSIFKKINEILCYNITKNLRINKIELNYIDKRNMREKNNEKIKFQLKISKIQNLRFSTRDSTLIIIANLTQFAVSIINSLLFKYCVAVGARAKVISNKHFEDCVSYRKKIVYSMRAMN